MSRLRELTRQVVAKQLHDPRTRRLGKAALGVALIAGGIPLLILPGPGLGLIAAGSGLLADARRDGRSAQPGRPPRFRSRRVLRRRGSSPRP